MVKKVILFFINLVFLGFVFAVPSPVSRSGPFEAKIVRASPCEKLTLPIDTDPQVTFHAEVYNTSTKTNLLRGNITILRDCKNKKIKAKAYSLEGGKWKLAYLMNNMGCHSVFMPIVSLVTRVKYDQKNCVFFKGKYSFDNMDTNRTQHMFTTIQEYGRIMWRNEFFTKAGSAFCYEFETIVVPLLKKT